MTRKKWDWSYTIKRHLLDTNATHKAFADGVGMSPQQVSNMLKGRWHPSVASIERIADHFGVAAWILVKAAETGQSIDDLSISLKVTLQ